MADLNFDQMDIKEAFYMLITYIDEDDEELANTYEKVRNGITTKFDIYDYINGVMIIKPKVGKALYRGKTIELSKLWDEIEERTITARKWLKDNIKTGLSVSAYKRER